MEIGNRSTQRWPQKGGGQRTRSARRTACGEQRRTAFTLVEMVIVLAIIILVLAIAIPLWNALMGNNSLAAAQNQVAAVLTNARSDAMYNHQTIGVFFFIDPTSNQTALAEVQVQTLYQPAQSSYSGTLGNTSLFIPGSWTAGTPPTWNPYNATNAKFNGPINSIELVNNIYYDPNIPNAPPQNLYYRDIVLLPAGVGVALNCNSYTYNQYNEWANANPNPPITINYPLDRYRRVGAIVFAPDGTLTQTAFGIPYVEYMNQTNYNNKIYQVSPLYKRLFGTIPNPTVDFCSTVAWGGTQPISNPGGSPSFVPLQSSVGLVIYDRTAYLSQRATLIVSSSAGGGTPTQTTIGSGDTFSEMDMNVDLPARTTADQNFQSLPPTTMPPTSPTQASDKFIEENWIDQNGVSLLVSPYNGSLIKAK